MRFTRVEDRESKVEDRGSRIGVCNLRRSTFDLRPSAPRGGSTLTEVLISLLAMGIGLVTVATMFPMAVLQTVKATQLTNATILRYNVEGYIDGDPRLVHDPDVDGIYTDHNSEDIDRDGLLDAEEDDGNANAPLYDDADGVLDRAYVVDPLGYWQMYTITSDPLLAGKFGNDGAATATAKGSIKRYAFNTFVDDGSGNPDLAECVKAAAKLVTLPDSWIDLLDEDAIPTAVATNGLSVDLPSDVDLSSITPAPNDGVVERIVLFDQINRTSQTRVISAVDNSTKRVSWDDALPSGFSADRVRLQVQDRRYTWLLTVRKTTTAGTANVPSGLPPGLRAQLQDDVDGAATASVDVVVLFGGRGNLDDERVYDGPAGRTFRNDVSLGPVVEFNPAGQEPFYKKGSFVFDTEFGYWYRVLDILSESSTQVVLKLDRPVVEQTPQGIAGGVLLMPGVIDVYPIGQK